MSEVKTWLEVLGSIPGNMPQRQDGTTDQLIDLILFANRLGFYDAADYLKSAVKEYK